MKHFRTPAVIIRSLHMHEFRRNHQIPDEPNRCMNCGHEYLGNYCPACGQNRRVRPVSFINAMKAIPHFVTSADHNIFYTYLELIMRPGHAMRDYLRGHRVRYANPGRLLCFLLLIYLLLCYMMSLPELHYAFALPMGVTDAWQKVLSWLPDKMSAKLVAATTNGSLAVALESLRKWFGGNVAVHIVLQVPLYALATMYAFRKTEAKTASQRVSERAQRMVDEDDEDFGETISDSSIFDSLVIMPMRPFLRLVKGGLSSLYSRVKELFSKVGKFVGSHIGLRPEPIIKAVRLSGGLIDSCEEEMRETLRHHTSPRGRVGIRHYNFLEMMLMRCFVAIMFLTINLVALFFGYRLSTFNLIFVFLTFIIYKQFYSQHWLFTIVKTLKMYVCFTLMVVGLALLFVLFAMIHSAVA